MQEAQGVGRIPKDIDRENPTNARRRIPLENLPKLLKGYGRTHAGYGSGYEAAVIVVCDLDDKCLKEFRAELLAILYQCEPRPRARFCIAIEEGEAWLLGDKAAVVKAYPRAKNEALDNYVNDSVCGTWEALSDAVYPGGSVTLRPQGWQTVGEAKSEWAKAIAPHMDVENNASPRFQYFRDKLRADCA